MEFGIETLPIFVISVVTILLTRETLAIIKFSKRDVRIAKEKEKAMAELRSKLKEQTDKAKRDAFSEYILAKRSSHMSDRKAKLTHAHFHSMK